MNFDMPQAKKNDGPEINADGTVEFVFPTAEEKVVLDDAIKFGRAKNEESGGSGRILSSAEKAAGWYGNPDNEGSSEWAAGLEKPVEMAPVQAEKSKNSEAPGVVLSRQISDIAEKRAEVLSQLIQTTDENEKVRLRELEEIFQKGYEVKKKQYDALVLGQKDNADFALNDERISA
jgi:hypothetical protein